MEGCFMSLPPCGVHTQEPDAARFSPGFESRLDTETLLGARSSDLLAPPSSAAVKTVHKSQWHASITTISWCGAAVAKPEKTQRTMSLHPWVWKHIRAGTILPNPTQKVQGNHHLLSITIWILEHRATASCELISLKLPS
eukprot:3998336-Amphidinium_carterae.1